MHRLVVLLVVCGCTQTVETGGMCMLNSDCRAPLICASGLCRVQCVVDRDCLSLEMCDTGACVPRGDAGMDAGFRDASSDAGGDGGADLGADLGASDAGVDAGLVDAGPPCASGGACSPEDECAGAIALSGMPASGTFPTRGWSESSGSCNGDVDGYFLYNVPVRSLVAVWVTGDATAVGLTDSCGGLVSCGRRCGGSPGFPVYAFAVQTPGDHLALVEAPASGTSITIQVWAYPLGPTLLPAPLTVDGAGYALTSVTLTAGEPALPAATTCGATGPTQLLYYAACNTVARTTVLAACPSSGESVRIGLAALESAGTDMVCSSDITSGCPAMAMVTTPTSLPAGPRFVSIAGTSPTDVGDVTIEVSTTP